MRRPKISSWNTSKLTGITGKKTCSNSLRPNKNQWTRTASRASLTRPWHRVISITSTFKVKTRQWPAQLFINMINQWSYEETRKRSNEWHLCSHNPMVHRVSPLNSASVGWEGKQQTKMLRWVRCLSTLPPRGNIRHPTGTLFDLWTTEDHISTSNMAPKIKWWRRMISLFTKTAKFSSKTAACLASNNALRWRWTKTLTQTKRPYTVASKARTISLPVTYQK